MDKLKFSVLDYLGKIESGVLVLLSFTIEDEYYEGTFFYTDESILLTVDDLLENKLGVDNIENWEGYVELIRNILKSIIPYGEIYPRLDDVDFNKWNETLEKIEEDLKTDINEKNPDN
jgi:hypothetical protein